MSWGFSNGSFQIESGDTTVGGTRAWVISEFSFALPTLIFHLGMA